MTKLPFKVSYVLVCDDVRTEDTGKNMIIGLYSGGVRLPKGVSTFVAPLTFFILGHLKVGVGVHLKTWIEGPTGERMQESDFGVMQIPEGMPQMPLQAIWRLFPWDSKGTGHFKLHLTQDGRDSVIYEFEVVEN